jgi:hypothetical protein
MPLYYSVITFILLHYKYTTGPLNPSQSSLTRRQDLQPSDEHAGVLWLLRNAVNTQIQIAALLPSSCYPIKHTMGVIDDKHVDTDT